MDKAPSEGTTPKKDTMGTLTMAHRTQIPASAAGISLPSLQETIPEFFSHHPRTYERRPLCMPRRFSDRHSPGPSSSISDSSTGMLLPPSFKRRKLSVVVPNKPGEPILTGTSPAASLSEPGDHHVPRTSSVYPLPPSSYTDVDRRRLSSISATSLPEATQLPPVSSIATSRGSSFELDPAERPAPPGAPQSLPPIFSHNHPPTHSRSAYEPDHSRTYATQDYHYSSPSESQRPYHPPSPSSQYPALAPHQASQPYPPMRTGYMPPVPPPHLDRSPFSAGGSLPRLDVTVDHQYQQEIRPGKRRRGNLPKHVTDILRQWLNDHLAHPYPTEEEKNHLMNLTGLTMNQISNWFINARRRRLPPRTDETRNGTSSQAGSPRPIGGLLPYPPNHSR